MRKPKPPDPLRRRHLLEEKLPAVRAVAIAEAYLAEDRHFDALAWLAMAGDHDRLRGLQRDAIGRGDLFLVREIAGLLGEDPGSDVWQAVSQAAARAGRERDATEAARLAAARGGERPRAT